MALLEELRDHDGVTCLLTTHLVEEADRCDHVGIVDRGRLVALDTPAALKATIGGDVLTVRTTDPTALAETVAARFQVTAETVNGVLRIERGRGHEFVPQLIEAFPGMIGSVTVGKATLEDVFVRLTGHRLWDAAHGELDEHNG